MMENDPVETLSTFITSGDDHVIEVSAHGLHDPDSMVPSNGVGLLVEVEVYFQNASSPNCGCLLRRRLGYRTREVLLWPQIDMHPERWYEIMDKLIDLVKVPFSLDNDAKKQPEDTGLGGLRINWKGLYEGDGVNRFDECTTLAKSESLSARLASYLWQIKSFRPHQSLDDLFVKISISNFVTLDADKFNQWKAWSKDHPSEYNNLVNRKRLGNTRVDMNTSGEDHKYWADKECPICLDEFLSENPNNIKLLKLPCKHTYHEACILPWNKNHPTCPYCRAVCRLVRVPARLICLG